ncbi:MAG: hypothetical protein IPM77_05710 [Crocinitomicaceae bacterium]|nr:hypothetical protein [Crocinitomicaceae bacterium]
MKTWLKHINAFIVTVLFLTAANTVTAQNDGTKVIDRIVAQIGEEIILLSDIQNRRLEILQNGGTLEESTDCNLLEEMLFEKLLVNQAMIDSVEISDDMVNSEMENRLRYIATQIGSMEELENSTENPLLRSRENFSTSLKKE